MQTYAIKWEEKILVTSQNKDTLIWYTFIQEEQTDLEKLKQDLETITNELVNLNWRIKWAEDLKLAQIFDDDDELELLWYKWRLEELVIKRSEIKAKMKELL